jgi:hypothetical protein
MTKATVAGFRFKSKTLTSLFSFPTSTDAGHVKHDAKVLQCRYRKRRSEYSGHQVAAAYPGQGGKNGLGPGGGLELAVGVCFRHQALTYTFNFLAPFLAPPSVVNQVAKLLYQDENLRVFESPKESESAWEQEGLIVVQMPIETVP